MISLIRNIIYIRVNAHFVTEFILVLALICVLSKFEVTVLLCDYINILTLLMQL